MKYKDIVEDIELTGGTVLEPTKFNSLIICCDKIILSQASLELDIEIPNEKIKNIDYLVINGFRFKKDESE